MCADGFYVATRVVNPVLVKYRSFIIRAYGLRAIDKPHEYIHLSDVSLYVELERLRDSLARNEIVEEVFAERMLKLAAEHANLSSEVLRLLSELYQQLTGRSFPAEPSVGASQAVMHSVGRALELKGVCARCTVEGDHSQKALKRCEHCGEAFCEKHSTPRLALSLDQYQSYLAEYPDIADLLREHWESETGHPCAAYTSEFWRRYEAGRGRWGAEEHAVPAKAVSRSGRGEAERSIDTEVPVRVASPPQRTSPSGMVRIVAVAAVFVALAIALSYAAGVEGFLASVLALIVGVAREFAVVTGRVR
ncbi:MAG: hypothetical protein QXJ59_02765 [Thermofilaceae archaeon]